MLREEPIVDSSTTRQTRNTGGVSFVEFSP